MIYKIEGKYYIKIGEHFREIELVFSDNDVDLRPIGTFLENRPGLQVEAIDFMNEKGNLLEEHKHKNKDKDKDEDKPFKRDLFDK